MNTQQVEQLKEIQKALSSLGLKIAFVGGSIIPLLVDQPESLDFRETLDFDLIVEVLAESDYAKLEQILRKKGFQNDDRPGAPICRWIYKGAVVDIMPTHGKRIGLNTRWFKESLEASIERSPHSSPKTKIRVISPEYFIATKLEAFKDRGEGDYYASADLEDIVTILDGVGDIVERIHSLPNTVRKYIQDQFAKYLGDPLFVEALPGHLPHHAQKRFPSLLQKIQKITNNHLS